jgi:hypothetical protein
MVGPGGAEGSSDPALTMLGTRMKAPIIVMRRINDFVAVCFFMAVTSRWLLLLCVFSKKSW